jgi:hypothetical protein
MRVELEDGTPIELSDQNALGEGGEAWATRFEHASVAYAAKIYKGPDCKDYDGSTEQDRLNREGAKNRLATFASRIKSFPAGLPENVISPRGLLYRRRGKNRKPVGFFMDLVPEPREPLRRYCDATFRQAGVDTNDVIDMLVRLYETKKACHAGGLILGDFNDLNILGLRPYIIDAESGSYGGHQCTTFTQRFVDPLLCDPGKTSLMLVKPHSEDSDLYAWVCMVFQSLFLISPYEGIYKPKDKSKRCVQDARPLFRRTVLDPDSKWPKWVTSLGLTPSVMPDDLMHQIELVLHKDVREFPVKLLENTRWTKCSKCGHGHARRVCPQCSAPGIVRSVMEVKGTVTSERIFKTKGVILAAAYQGGMRWLVHENGVFNREQNRKVLDGELDPRIRYRISGSDTCLAKGNTLITVKPDGKQEKMPIDTYGQLPVYDANGRGRYWVHSGRLLADRHVGAIDVGERPIGQVLRNQTLVWVGEEFGFGFYRASDLSEFFVFDASSGILKDGLAVPPLRGRFVDATCSFSSQCCWFFATYEYGGKTINRCSVIDKNGELLGVTEEDAGGDTWLGSLRGKCAVGNFLFSATDDGIVRVEHSSGMVSVAKSFPDTEPFVDANCHLFPGDKCLHVVTRNEVRKLSIR